MSPTHSTERHVHLWHVGTALGHVWTCKLDQTCKLQQKFILFLLKYCTRASQWLQQWKYKSSVLKYCTKVSRKPYRERKYKNTIKILHKDITATTSGMKIQKCCIISDANDWSSGAQEQRRPYCTADKEGGWEQRLFGHLGSLTCVVDLQRQCCKRCLPPVHCHPAWLRFNRSLGAQHVATRPPAGESVVLNYCTGVLL